ncbi:MAG: acyl-CoA dehydrogenase family protein [Acidimicrobiales bacterium]|jgi:alkylation response protein AidB-like acyl-CoA dehydrogenase
MGTDSARAALADWRSAYPSDPFTADHRLRALLARALPEGRLHDLEKRASSFALEMTRVIGPAAARYEQRRHLPELSRWDSIGRRTESIEFDPSYDVAGAAVWASGLVASSGVPGTAYEQATLLYLLSAEGEAGHACPATCTIGLARALRRAAAPGVRDRFLPALVDTDYAAASRGSQFLTEVQGGSDVGANVCLAVPTGDGETYRISGEKWFCSVADAGQFFLTARIDGAPGGTRGLGSFVVPREVDGRPNGFSLRRLKDKLGTRGLASGEIDFDGALAWPIGPVEHGFRTAVGIVLNTSRWMTAVGDAGMMRRACVEASSYARHREAFGRAIGGFPAVRRTLADMAADSAGALHLVFALTGLEDRIDAATDSEEDVLLHRFLVNLAKYLVSCQTTDVVHSAIEVLGGNGAIEEFSVLPRLYRDAMVYESWEGSHNVLVAQVLTDLGRLPILDVVADWLLRAAEQAPDPDLSARLVEELDRAVESARRCVDDPEHGSWHFREVVGRIGLLAEATLLAEAGEVQLAWHLLLARVARDATAEDDPGFISRVDAIVDAMG